MDQNKITYNRGFRTLFEDSINLLGVAENNLYESDYQFIFARSSITCSLLMPEVCANICIEALSLEKAFFNEIDKLSPIAKFDFFLKMSFSDKRLDRGIKPVQILLELKSLRDKYVHPKKIKVTHEKVVNNEVNTISRKLSPQPEVNWEEILGNSDADIYQIDSARTNVTDISINPEMWEQHDAISALRGVHEFMAHFFRDLCGFSPSKVSSLLFSSSTTLDDEPEIHIYDDNFHAVIEQSKIDISYLEIEKSSRWVEI